MRNLLPVIIVLNLLLPTITGCGRENPVDEEFLAGSSLELRIDGNTVHAFNPLTWQVSFNKDRKEFRVQTDNQAEYYILKCQTLPVEEGQKLKANLSWTTPRGITTRNNMDFEVIRTDSDGTVWLWSGKDRTGVSVRGIL